MSTASDFTERYERKLNEFLGNGRRRYSHSDQHQSVRVDKHGVLTHAKYGYVLQVNKDGIPVVYCGNMSGNDLKASALRVMAECILERTLYFNAVGVEPKDGDWSNVTFGNVKFVDTEKGYEMDHSKPDMTGIKRQSDIWAENGYKPVPVPGA